jgi:hypothetical protein
LSGGKGGIIISNECCHLQSIWLLNIHVLQCLCLGWKHCWMSFYESFQNCCHSNLNVLKWLKMSHSEGHIHKSDGVLKMQYHEAEFSCFLKHLQFLTNVLP